MFEEGETQVRRKKFKLGGGNSSQEEEIQVKEGEIQVRRGKFKSGRSSWVGYGRTWSLGG
jgi:hypothetical protein